MRKQLRKALSMVLSAAMVVALGSGVDYKAVGAADAAAIDLDATLSVNDASNNLWGKANASFKLTGNGEYTVKVDNGAGQEITPSVTYINVKGMKATLPSQDVTKVSFAVTEVKADGEALSSTCAAVTAANMSEGSTDKTPDGSWQVDLNNMYNTNYGDTFDPDAAKFDTSFEITFTINVEGWPEKKPESTEPAPTTSGNEPSPTTSGPAPTTSGGGVPEKHDVNFDATLNFQDANGSWNWGYVDLKVTGNGEYTVTMNEENLKEGNPGVNACIAAGDPVTNAWLQITDGVEMVEQKGTVTVSSLTVDGEEIAIQNEEAEVGYPDGKKDSPHGRATIMNAWGDAANNVFEDFEMGDEAELTFTINVPTWTDKPAAPEPIEFKEPTTAQLRYGWDVSREDAEVEVSDAEVTGEGQYKVGIDLRKKVSTDGSCVDVQILDVEENYPDWLIRVDEVRVNGEVVDAELLKKTYTCLDGEQTTGVLYNKYKPADEPAKGEHNERALVDLSEVSPQALESCFRDEDGEGLEIKMVEVAFTYGTKDYVTAQAPYALGDSLFEAGTETSATPAPTATATVKPGTTGTPAPKATATAAPKQTTKPGSTTPTSAPKGTTVKDNNGSYKVTATGAVEYAPSAAAKKKSTVKIPDTVKVNGVTYKVTSIKKKAFAKNKKLTKLTIGNNIKTIGDEAFSTCSKLKSVTFGKSVKKIGKKAFFKCKKLKTAKFLGSGAVSVGKQAFKGTPKKMKVNVKKMKKKNYKKTTKALKKGGMKSPKFTPKKAPKK